MSARSLRARLWLALAVTPALLGIAADRFAPADSPSRVVAAARNFMNTLTDAQREKARFAFGDDERRNWAFVPGQYPGIALAALDLSQRRLAQALLREALGSSGYQRTLWIQRLEDVLRAKESTPDRIAAHRDPERYALAIFGEPVESGAFGIRFQGHHVSWNLVVRDGAVHTSLPTFFGANPAELRDGPFAGTGPMLREDTEAAALLAALDDAQRARAIVDGKCPADIVLGPGRSLELPKAPEGIAFAELQGSARDCARGLVDLFLDGTPGRSELTRRWSTAEGFAAIAFTWAGSKEPGAAHYWRLRDDRFVVEACNIQDGANHIHLVIHDLRDDFAVDSLKAHLEAETRGK
ncbi:MAG: DUF3500 domain-containing protein [Planctomycetota bacterium]